MSADPTSILTRFYNKQTKTAQHNSQKYCNYRYICAAVIFWEFDIRHSFVLVRFVVNSIDKHNPKYYTMWLKKQTSSCYAFKTLGHAALPVSTSISNYSTRIPLFNWKPSDICDHQWCNLAKSATKTFAQTHSQTLATVVCHLTARNSDWTGHTEV